MSISPAENRPEAKIGVVAPDRFRLAVLGPGGVGGLLAALLARAGDSVVVLAGDSTARTIADRGLRVESRLFGDFQVRVNSAVRLQTKLAACLVTVKATQLDSSWIGWRWRNDGPRPGPRTPSPLRLSLP